MHYCSQQRGYPAVPLETYSKADVRREYHTQKSCAPFCTVSCVQQVAMLDNWRQEAQRIPESRPRPAEALVQLQTVLDEE